MESPPVLVSTLDKNIRTPYDETSFTFVEVPIFLIHVEPFPDITNDLQQQDISNICSDAVLPLLQDVPSITYNPLELTIAVPNTAIEKLTEDAYTLFPFLDLNRPRKSDPNLARQYCEEAGEILNSSADKARSHILKRLVKVLQLINLDSDQLAERIIYFGIQCEPVKSFQELVYRIAEVSLNASRFCETWLPAVCQVFLISLRSRSFFVVPSDGSVTIPSWLSLTTNALLAQLLQIVFMKDVEEHWDFQRDASGIPPPLVQLFNLILKKVPELQTLTCPNKVPSDVFNKVVALSTSSLVPNLFPYTLTLGMSGRRRMTFLFLTYAQQFMGSARATDPAKASARIVMYSLLAYLRIVAWVIGQKCQSQPGVYIDKSILVAAEEKLMASNSQLINVASPENAELVTSTLNSIV